MRKGIVIFLIAAACVTGAGTVFADGLKIAVIDVARILNESDAGKQARKEMEQRFEELKKKVDARDAEARKMKEDLDRQKVVMGKEKAKKAEEELQAKVKELQQLAQDSEKEMQGRQRDVEKRILTAIEGEVTRVVEAEKIDLLFDRVQGGVIHFPPAIDITEKVLALVNKPAAEAPKGQGGGK